MPYTAPVTDWISTDKYNIADLERVRDNIIYAAAYIDAIFGTTTTLNTISTVDGTLTMFKVGLYNNVEDNLDALMDVVGVAPADWEDTETWYEYNNASYTRNPDFRDYNRWELNIDCLLDDVDLMEPRFKVCGTLVAGQTHALPRKVI